MSFDACIELEMDADVLEDVAEVAQLLAAGRRGLRHEVEYLSVLVTVIGKTGDPPLLVEIDGDHALIDHFMRHECRRALRLLRDVIKGVAVDGGDGGGRAEHDQDLLLRGADGNLFERTFRQHVAALERLSGAPAGRERQHAGKSQRQVEGRFATHDFRSQTLHFGLASGTALT